MSGMSLPDNPLAGERISDLLSRSSEQVDPRTPAADAARKFETLLLHKLVDTMRQTIPDEGLLSSPTGKQLEGLFWHHLADMIGEQGGMGLHSQLQRQIDTFDGGPDAPPSLELSR